MKAKTVVLLLSILLGLVGLAFLVVPPYSEPGTLWGAHRIQIGYAAVTVAVSLYVVEQIVRRAVDREVRDQLSRQLRERSVLPLGNLRENAAELGSISLSALQTAYPEYDEAAETMIGRLVEVPTEDILLVELATALAGRGYKTTGVATERDELKEALGKIAATRADLVHALLHANQFLDRQQAAGLKGLLSLEKLGHLQLKGAMGRMPASGRIPGYVVDAFVAYHVVCQRLARLCQHLEVQGL